MIRIEGIPMVAARLEAAQKAKTTKARQHARVATKSAGTVSKRRVTCAAQ
jgi:hypothetical protein